MDLTLFTQEVLSLQDRLFRYGCSIIRDNKDVEDILQNVFLKLWVMRKELKDYKSIEGLTFTIMRNSCLDFLRSQKRMKTHMTNHSQAQVEFATPERIMELKESQKVIREIVQNLPGKQRDVLHLRNVEGYSTDEICEITGLSPNAVEANLSRARKKVREKYLKHSEWTVH